MARRPGRVGAVMAALLMVVLSGCAGGTPQTTGPGPQPVPSETQPPQDDPRPAVNDTEPPDEPASEPEPRADRPPVISYTLVAPNVDRNGSTWEVDGGGNVDFDATNSTDPAAGALNFTWDFGDGTLLYGDRVTYTFLDARNFLILLHAASDASNLTSDESVLVSVKAAQVEDESRSLHLDDPPGDAAAPTSDILAIDVSDDGSEVTFVFTMAEIDPASGGNSVLPRIYMLKPGGAEAHRFEIYRCAGTEYLLYDYTNSVDVPGSAVSVQGTQYVATVPFTYFANDPLPFEFFFRIHLSSQGCSAPATLIDDRAPNSGNAVYA